ncbi:MAG: DUF763 domain-containing protein [Candidatus Bathyarchaeia archaeon]
MRRVGVAELPLHQGRCPPWLFKRMKRLGGAIAELIIHEHGRREFLRRIGDPFFFQALGCTLGFDWHSSGVTTTVCGALKEAIKPEELGIAVCGGKGKVSKQTQNEIEEVADCLSLSSQRIDSLRYASRMAAKVDNSCLQDGYQLYHHCFIVSEDGDWAVVQQGMQEHLARRYHWLSENMRSFVEEPHSGIASDRQEQSVLDMTAGESEEARKTSLDLVLDEPQRLSGLIREAKQASIDEYLPHRSQMLTLVMPTQHTIQELTDRTIAALHRAYEIQPESYEELVAIRGIGPKAVRALALVSELIYGASASWRDPAKYSFAHGGKDGIPYPVDRRTYDKTIEIIENAALSANIGQNEKIDAVRRLHEFL